MFTRQNTCIMLSSILTSLLPSRDLAALPKSINTPNTRDKLQQTTLQFFTLYCQTSLKDNELTEDVRSSLDLISSL